MTVCKFKNIPGKGSEPPYYQGLSENLKSELIGILLTFNVNNGRYLLDTFLVLGHT